MKCHEESPYSTYSCSYMYCMFKYINIQTENAVLCSFMNQEKLPWDTLLPCIASPTDIYICISKYIYTRLFGALGALTSGGPSRLWFCCWTILETFKYWYFTEMSLLIFQYSFEIEMLISFIYNSVNAHGGRNIDWTTCKCMEILVSSIYTSHLFNLWDRGLDFPKDKRAGSRYGQ